MVGDLHSKKIVSQGKVSDGNQEVSWLLFTRVNPTSAHWQEEYPIYKCLPRLAQR